MHVFSKALLNQHPFSTATYIRRYRIGRNKLDSTKFHSGNANQNLKYLPIKLRETKTLNYKTVAGTLWGAVAIRPIIVNGDRLMA
jgi:hypothetical protein